MTQLHTVVKTSKGVELKLNTGLFINNEFVAGSDERIETVNPTTGETICEVENANEADVDKAVAAAKTAYLKVWKQTIPTERQRLMNKLADLLERDAEILAQIETLDNGKTLKDSRTFDVLEIIKSLRYYAGYADKIHGKVINTPGALSYTVHEPIGVCGAIIPWNFPLMMLGWKIAPALATGNVIIVKTSEFTPLSALKVAELIKEAGFPPGVVNIITGYGHVTGNALASHKEVSKIAFTGSTAVGRHVMKAAAESNLKKVTLELGGKSPNIIFEDADLDKAVFWAHKGIFFNHGQCCCAGSRIYVQESIHDKFLEKFKAKIEGMNLGDPTDDNTHQGPQVSQQQFDRIMAYIKHGEDEGAKVCIGGKRHGDKGFFIEPTVFTNVKSDMKIMREEIFGPVVAISTFKTLDEVIEEAHDTTYGLAAAVFTENITRATEVSQRLEAGTVWVNCYNELDPQTPFGGYHESGIGRENGEYGLDNYLQVKTVKINVSRGPQKA